MLSLDCNAAEVVVVVPPFASPDRPALGPHVVAARATQAGYAAKVIYANLSFAHILGVRAYQRLCATPTGLLIGERIFARAMFGPAADSRMEPDVAQAIADAMSQTANADLVRLQTIAEAWVDEFAAELSRTTAFVVGFSTVFEQTLAAMSIARRIKIAAPDKILLLGGANVDGLLSVGIQQIAGSIDHIFSGESDASFVGFLNGLRTSKPRPGKIINGTPFEELDQSAPPDYDDYFEQMAQTVSEDVHPDGLRPDELWLPYETSRGCWWGAKQHCTFCGLNANGMQHRQKSHKKVIAELDKLVNKHDVTRIMMVDNIMPHSYFSTLLPELEKAENKISIFYEQKANLSFKKMKLLKSAGVERIQPGIESLATSVLKLMRKGSTLKINLDCLRFARALGIEAAWNLLTDFPGDEDVAYEEMADLVPLLHHLQPPIGIGRLSIERFSPYFDKREEFGISNVRPIAAYELAFPTVHNLESLAYHFVGDYDSSLRRNPSLSRRLAAYVERWRASWGPDQELPILTVIDVPPDRSLLIDTRECAPKDAELLDEAATSVCLSGIGKDDDVAWALDRGYIHDDHGQILPLATATESLLQKFESSGSEQRGLMRRQSDSAQQHAEARVVG
jgi:ribosomal peptide maturation radical SAM protein 1